MRAISTAGHAGFKACGEPGGVRPLDEAGTHGGESGFGLNAVGILAI
ncbi:hypothetical protein [Candidatus Regiella insecticola]|nr:hypothetical protein [Candidatus Regiella insecticola]